MSSRKATESFCFIHTTQYIYEEDNKSALERLGWQATFKFRALWSIKDGKGLIPAVINSSYFVLFITFCIGKQVSKLCRNVHKNI